MVKMLLFLMQTEFQIQQSLKRKFVLVRFKTSDVVKYAVIKIMYITDWLSNNLIQTPLLMTLLI